MSMKKLNSPMIKKKSINNAQISEESANRPFTLPPGEFKPKQSLGQNFLTDQNYVLKIVNSFSDSIDSSNGSNVIEIGPGPGSLTKTLIQRYPEMMAIEIDQRAVELLNTKFPQLKVKHMDVLNADWVSLAEERACALNIIGNLPYNIVSQVLFSLADSHKAINTAVLTMQLEVAERVTAAHSTKDYGIPSVVFQLYGKVEMNFKIPPTVFYPRPKIDSALVTFDFTKPHKDLYRVNSGDLRKVVNTAFRQRRKMMRQSLKELMIQDNLIIPDRWATLRPEQLIPEQFIELTADLYGEASQVETYDVNKLSMFDSKDKIWRASMKSL
eukprot:gene16707-22854_t